MTSPTSVDPYALILSQLEAQKAQIDAAIATIKDTREKFGRQSGPLSPVSVQLESNAAVSGNGFVIAANAFHKLNVPEATLKYFSLRKRDAATHAEICDALKAGGQSSATGENFGTVVFNALKRMEKRGIMTRIDNQWAPSEWRQEGLFQTEKKNC